MSQEAQLRCPVCRASWPRAEAHPGVRCPRCGVVLHRQNQVLDPLQTKWFDTIFRMVIDLRENWDIDEGRADHPPAGEQAGKVFEKFWPWYLVNETVPERTVESWLRTTVRRTLINGIRAADRQRERHVQLTEVEMMYQWSTEPSIAEPWELNVARMPRVTEMEAFVLNFVYHSGDWAPSEIARYLRIAESTVRTYLDRLRRKATSQETLVAMTREVRERMARWADSVETWAEECGYRGPLNSYKGEATARFVHLWSVNRTFTAAGIDCLTMFRCDNPGSAFQFLDRVVRGRRVVFLDPAIELCDPRKVGYIEFFAWFGIFVNYIRGTAYLLNLEEPAAVAERLALMRDRMLHTRFC